MKYTKRPIGSIPDGRFWLDSAATTCRLASLHRLPVHDGCVNALCWSGDGQLLLSGADDRSLVVSAPFSPARPVLHRVRSGHRGNVFSARFLPATNNGLVVSCGADGAVILTDLERVDTHGKFVFSCHDRTTYQVCVIADDANTFLSCGEDGCVRWFDRRQKTSCDRCVDDVIVQWRGSSACAIDVNPARPSALLVGFADSMARVYDLRRLSKPNCDVTGLIGMQSCACLPSAVNAPSRRRITSAVFSNDGKQFLLSFSSDYIYLFDFQKFTDKKIDVGAFDGAVDRQPRKIRLRGDWSDTGPQARPVVDQPVPQDVQAPLLEARREVLERHDASGERRPGQNLMRRLSDMLTGWFDTHTSEGRRTEAAAVATAEDDERSLTTDESSLTDVSLDEVVADAPVSEPDSAPSTSASSDAAGGGQRERVQRMILRKLMQSMPQHENVAVFKGHRNARTMLKQTAFWGDAHVLSGSDCGHLFVWDKRSTRLLLALPADSHVVNCVQPNPHLPVLATSGLNYDVKLWAPIASEQLADEDALALVRVGGRLLG